MQPNRQRTSMDGMQRPKPVHKIRPDLRPDHELPAPEPTPLLKKGASTTPLPPVADSEKSDPVLSLSTQQPFRIKKWLVATIAGLLIAAAATFFTAYGWYQSQLAPVSSDTTKHIMVLIKSGMTPSEIGALLQKSGVIRSQLAFGVYTKLSGTENKLKAGSYSFQPSLSTPAIVDHIVAGKQDTFDVTFLPGDILMNNRKKLIDLGIFSTAEIDAALAKSYNRPLFATKPAAADLEGYLYGETIEFDSSATVESILGRFFDEYEAVITDNNLVAGFQKQGLSLFEGITLASIVQRETSNPDSQRQVARVFLNRMQQGMNLGSDVTYQYAAKMMGVAPDPKLDSLYNTRIHAGLPPGPIATPGKTALQAVANPASNGYLFFLAGDDNVMHYAKTDAQHQQNIVKYCRVKCATP